MKKPAMHYNSTSARMGVCNTRGDVSESTTETTCKRCQRTDRWREEHARETRSSIKRNIRKWVEALRSGAYKQAKGQLRKVSTTGNILKSTVKVHGYCCLGVACEISRRGEWTPSDAEIYQDRGAKSSDGERAELTREVMKWLGLVDTDPELDTSEGDIVTASELNDRGVSFKTIASAIERTFLKPKKRARRDMR